MKRVFFISLVVIVSVFLVISCVPQKPTDNSGGSQVTKKDIYGWKLSILSSTNPDSGIPVSEIEGKVIRVIPTSSGSNAIISDATTSIFVYKANIEQSDLGKRIVIKNSVGKTYQKSLEIEMSTTSQKELSEDSTELSPTLLDTALSNTPSNEIRALWDIRYATVYGHFTGNLGSITNTYEFEYKTSDGETTTILVYKKDDIDTVYTPNTTTPATLTGYTKYFNGTWEFVVFPEEIEMELPEVNNVQSSYNPNTKKLTINWTSEVQSANFEVTLYGEENILNREIVAEPTISFLVDDINTVKLIGIKVSKSKSQSKEKIIPSSQIAIVSISLVSNLQAKYDDYNKKMHITWEWDSTTEVPEKYVIYRKSSSVYEKIGESMEKSFEYEETNYEQLEGYAVAAVVNGEEGPKKDIDKATIKYTFAGGDGSESNPFLIGTPNQLKLLEEYKTLNKYFKLISDIDLNGHTWLPIGTYVSSTDFSKAFQGVIDGDYHKIKNVTFNDGNVSNIGLFGYIYNSTVKNLILENFTVVAKSFVGALAGGIRNSTIEKIAVTNSYIEAKDSSSSNYAGGIVGDINVGNTVSNCLIKDTTVKGAKDRIGGFAGRIYGTSTSKTTVINCYVQSTTAEVTGASGATINAGGFVGYYNIASDSGGVVNCYSAIKVTNGGGFAGNSASTGKTGAVSNYYDKEIANTTVDALGETYGVYAKTTLEMKQQSTFQGWDFTNIWVINEGTDYPRLKWETN